MGVWVGAEAGVSATRGTAPGSAVAASGVDDARAADCGGPDTVAGSSPVPQAAAVNASVSTMAAMAR